MKKVYEKFDPYMQIAHQDMIVPPIRSSDLSTSHIKGVVTAPVFMTSLTSYVTSACASAGVTSLPDPEWQMMAKYVKIHQYDKQT